MLLAVLVLAAWTFYPALRVQYQESRERDRLAAELADLKDRNDALSAQVERLKTPEGVEELARENLGMVKEGEHLYVVLDPEATATAGPPEPDPEADDPFWVDLLDLVFGVR